jgi:hypothetical protein
LISASGVITWTTPVKGFDDLVEILTSMILRASLISNSLVSLRSFGPLWRSVLRQEPNADLAAGHTDQLTSAKHKTRRGQQQKEFAEV